MGPGVQGGGLLQYRERIRAPEMWAVKVNAVPFLPMAGGCSGYKYNIDLKFVARYLISFIPFSDLDIALEK